MIIRALICKLNCLAIVYDAPFGIAPIGLQGLIWPKLTEILAKAALQT
jgi:L-lactate dehydrogenase (cytochrome)